MYQTLLLDSALLTLQQQLVDTYSGREHVHQYKTKLNIFEWKMGQLGQ